jgi:hypothetical protein
LADVSMYFFRGSMWKGLPRGTNQMTRGESTHEQRGLRSAST